MPESCVVLDPLNNEGAGKAGRRLHPWVPCNRKHGGRTTGSTGITPAFPAQWFTAYFVLSPVTGLFCHRHPRKCLSRTWRQHRGARTTRLRRPLEPRSSGVTPTSTASRSASVTIASRPSWERDGRGYTPDLGFLKIRIFSGEGLDADLPDGLILEVVGRAQGIHFHSVGTHTPIPSVVRNDPLSASTLAQQDAHARVQAQTDRRNIAFRGPPILRGIP
jgi:hypothetical protein